MNWKPKPGTVYPALLIKDKDDSFGVMMFPTTKERDREMTHIIRKQIRDSCVNFPPMPFGDCPVPVRAKIVGAGRLAVEMGTQWVETDYETTSHRKKRRKSRKARTIEIAIPIETDAQGEEVLAKLFTDNPDRVETLPDGSQAITFRPDDFEITEDN